MDEVIKSPPVIPCPYVGLQPYSEADHQYFFGRQRDSRLIASNLYASHLTVLYGPSGVGKSSVLRAGVIPRLRASPRTAVVIVDTWSERDILSAVKTKCLEAIAFLQGVNEFQPDLNLPLDEFLFSITHKLGCTLTIIFDQFEEYFLYHPAKDDSFDTEFAPAVNREEIDANFLIALREDALSKLDRFYTRVPNMLGNTIRLKHLDAKSARDAIMKPLEVHSEFHPGGPPFSVEDILVKELIDEVQVEKLMIGQGGRGVFEGSEITSDSEIRIETPFLQLVLTRLWDEEIEQGSTILRLETLKALGGAVRIVRTHMDAAMNTLSQKEQETAASIFRYMVTPSGTKIAYSISDLEYYAGPGHSLESVLEKLARGNVRIMRAVASPGRQGTVQYEIYHDVLAQAVLDWRARYEDSKQLLDLFFALNEKSDMEAALQTYYDVIQRAPQQAFFPDHYSVRKVIGRDELGVNFLLFDREKNHFVFATILDTFFILTWEDLEQFTRQMSKFFHPRISRVLGFSQHRNHTYIVNEYIDGQTLFTRLKGELPIAYVEAMKVTKEITEILGRGHEQGLPHLSLRPSSVMLTTEGVKLVNYGITRLTSLNRNPNRSTRRYSDTYLAPEQISGQYGDERSDIYALGTILYEMLTGHPPSLENFTNASEDNPEVLENVDKLIGHARKSDPDQRFTTVKEMQTEIDRISKSGKLIRYLRVALAWTSEQYRKLTTRKGFIFLLVVWAVFFALSMIQSLSYPIILSARFITALLLNSFVLSIMYDWIIRHLARRRGLASLHSSGRGMGAIIGMILTLQMVNILGFKTIYWTSDVLSLEVVMLVLAIILATLALVFIMTISWISELIFKSYASGFYWSFMVIVTLEVILTILGQPAGLITST